MVPASFGCGSAVLAATAMLAPSRAARSAMASPMPRLAPVMNSVLPARLTRSLPRSHISRSVPRGLELDPVAVGVVDIEGATLPLRPVTGTGLVDRHTPRAEPGDERRLIERRDGHAEVLEVAPGARRLAGTERTIERHEIDEACSCAQLCEAQLRLLALDRAPQNVAIEGERVPQVPHPQHDVVDPLDRERVFRHEVVSSDLRARAAEV